MAFAAPDAQAVVKAIREVAASEIMPRFRNLGAGDVESKSAFDDLVTVADRAAEAALTARIRDLLPGYAVVGEEAVAADPSVLDRVGGDRVVVIDPIDGTWNFAHGLANFGVIVAVLEAGRTVWGCLYDPGFDDWIEAHRGQGAFFHRHGGARRLTVSGHDAPLDRLRGNVGEYLYPQACRAPLAGMIPMFRRSVSQGSSLHEYRLLALGGSDFVLNGMLNVWDHAAGVLILEEAGGVARLLDGRDYEPTMREGRLLTTRTEAMWQALAEAFNGALDGL